MLLNLHSHLEGRVRPSTAAELGETLGLSAPVEGWAAALQLPCPSDLTVYLAKVSTTYPFFSRRESLTRIAREAVEDAAADAEDYLELRFGPASHVGGDMDLDAVISAVCEGVAQGSAATGMPAATVVCALRLHDQATNEAVAHAAARAAGKGVVGFDLAGDELLYPDLASFAGAFGIARAAGLGLTCHAAEAAPAGAALDAVRLLGVSRIGHGATVRDDPVVMRALAEAGVVIEVCPSSNLFTGAIPCLETHPAADLRRGGVSLVLGDDNPRQTGSLLRSERQILRDRLGFDRSMLHDLDRTSIAAGFMEESVRATLRARFEVEAGSPHKNEKR